ASLALRDGEGPVALIEGFTLRRVSAAAGAHDPLFAVSWKERSRVVAAEKNAAAGAPVLLVADTGGRATALAELLAHRGLTATAIDLPETPFETGDQLDAALRQVCGVALERIQQ